MVKRSDPSELHVLVVEDDDIHAEFLRYNFEHESFGVRVARNYDEAIAAVKDAPPDLIVLDWILPGVSGLFLCRQLRTDLETRFLPILMITAKGEEADRVCGLEAGADDYLVKPVSPHELMARVRAILRRTVPSFGTEELAVRNIVMNLATHRVQLSGEDVYLGPIEYRMLRIFMQRAGRVVTREQLRNLIWGRNSDLNLRSIDVHIRRLRMALSRVDDREHIETVRTIGYVLGFSHQPVESFNGAADRLDAPSSDSPPERVLRHLKS